MVFNLGFSVWSVHAFSASTTGIPARIRVAICRVMMAISINWTRWNALLSSTSREPLAAMVFPRRTVPAWPPPAFSEYCVRKIPCLRNCVRSILGLSESSTPFTFFPEESTPLYWNTATKRPLQLQSLHGRLLRPLSRRRALSAHHHPSSSTSLPWAPLSWWFPLPRFW